MSKELREAKKSCSSLTLWGRKLSSIHQLKEPNEVNVFYEILCARELTPMAFDALHIIWTIQNYRQPGDEKGDWIPLSELYKDLEHNGHYYEQSVPLRRSNSRLNTQNIKPLTIDEQNKIEKYLLQLLAPNGDRIVGGLSYCCLVVTSTHIQLLFTPGLPSHQQIIGRLKSKTASNLLRLSERANDKSIWSKGYWFAYINGDEAIAKIERFINASRVKL